MQITVETTIRADIDTVWAAWNTRDDINQWNAASDEWHTTQSHVDLLVGGRFSYRMEAKDGSMGFDFEGTYTRIFEPTLIEYEMDDDRIVSVDFIVLEDGVKVVEAFDAEDEHEAEMQRQGWQSILHNFARHVESKM